MTRVARGGVPTGTEQYLREHRHELYEAWWEEAACAGGDTNAWFGERRGPHSDDTKLALSICEGCPVKDECLAWVAERRDQLDAMDIPLIIVRELRDRLLPLDDQDASVGKPI